MPVPSTVNDLDPTASNNSPAGSEPIGPDLDAYLRSHAAIIRQVSDASKTDVQTHAATSKATPVDADELPIADSAASFGLKKLTLANLKAALKTYFDTLYLKLSGGTLTGLLKFAAGSNIASAATVDMTSATGNTVHITGTTGINAWTMTAGQFMQVIFDGVLTLTHHATNNNLQGSANITTAAGDRAFLFYDGTTVYVFQYIRADGTALVGTGVLTKEFISPQQTMTTAGLLTLAHGLGVAPKLIEFDAVCVTADLNYSVGDVIKLSPVTDSSRGPQAYKDATNIYVRFGTTAVGAPANKTTGVSTNMTAANWRLIVKAWG